MNVSDRFKILIADLKANKKIKTQKELGVLLGFETESAFSQVVNNKVPFSESLYSRIHSLYNDVNIDWLRTGKGSMLKEENKSRSVFEPENAGDEPTGYYYPNVNAAAGLDISTLNEDIERLPMYLPLFGKGIDYINVYGDSMYPKYNAGEVIGIKEIEFQYLNYGYPYVVVFNNGDVYIKYVKKGKDENHVLLESENTFYEPREFHLELIKSFYSIRGVVKKEMM